MLLFWGGGMFDGSVDSDRGKGFFFPFLVGTGWRCEGGVKQALTCGLRVETEQATFRGGPCRLPGR